MQLSANLSCLSAWGDVEKAMTLCREAGFDAGDFYLAVMTDENNVFCTDAWRAEAERCRAASDRIGLPINQTHAPYRFLKRRLREEHYIDDVVLPRVKRSIEISAILGAKTVVVHPLHHFPYRGHEEEAFAMNMSYFGELLPVAKDQNVKIAIENMWQRDAIRGNIIMDVCNTPAELARYIDALDSEFAVACLDIGHIVLPARDDTPADFIRALGKDRLGTLHVHDNNFCEDQHYPPFSGIVNWGEVTQALGEIDYAGDFTYEVNSKMFGGADDAFLPVSLRYLHDIGRYLVSRIEAARP